MKFILEHLDLQYLHYDFSKFLYVKQYLQNLKLYLHLYMYDTLIDFNSKTI